MYPCTYPQCVQCILTPPHDFMPVQSEGMRSKRERMHKHGTYSRPEAFRKRCSPRDPRPLKQSIPKKNSNLIIRQITTNNPKSQCWLTVRELDLNCLKGATIHSRGLEGSAAVDGCAKNGGCLLSPPAMLMTVWTTCR